MQLAEHNPGVCVSACYNWTLRSRLLLIAQLQAIPKCYSYLGSNLLLLDYIKEIELTRNPQQHGQGEVICKFVG